MLLAYLYCWTMMITLVKSNVSIVDILAKVMRRN